jgi:hypothetical protein
MNRESAVAVTHTPEVVMSTTWNRQVALSADGTLVVSTPSGGNPDGRNDPADSISLHPADLPATIRYNGIDGVQLNGVNWDGVHDGVTSSVQGTTVTVTDTGGTPNVSYFVTDNANHTTEDPQIHNLDT